MQTMFHSLTSTPPRPFRALPAALAAASLVAILAVTTGSAARAATDPIGTAGAVNPASNQTPPGGTTRIVEIGNRVVRNERIVTSANGSVQLLFVDKTSLNIGPNSTIIIDEFVYNPQDSTGKMAVSVVQGVLRFVGGNASHTGGATIKMPSVTLGVRGGVIQAESRGGTDTGVLLFGRAEFSNGSQTQVVRRPGWGIQVGPGGQMSPPQKFNLQQLAQLNAQVIPPNSRGGAGRRPTEQAAQQQLGPGTSGPPPQTIQGVQPQTTAEPTTTGGPLQLTGSVDQATLNDTIQTSSQNQGTRVTAEERVRRGPRYFALNMGRDTNLGAPVPYLPAAFVAAGTFRQSNVIGYYPGTASDGSPRAARALQAGLNITGSGASQASTIYLMTTNFYTSENTGQYLSNGGFAASTRRGSNLTAGFARGTVTAYPPDIASENGVPTGGTFTQNDVDSFDRLISDTASFNAGGGAGGGTYGYTQTATTASYTPSASGRPSVFLQGWAGGLGRTTSVNANSVVGPSYMLVGTTYLALDENDTRMSGGVFVTRGYDANNPSQAANDNFTTGTFLFGYFGQGTRSRSAYVDYDNFGAREAAFNDGTRLSNVNGVSLTNQNALLVTSKTVDAESFFPAVTFCRCDYTRWGFWSSQTTRPDSGDTLQDRIHLGTWVAGRYTDPALMPTVGTATFTGHAIGSFKDGANEYVAAGNLNALVDFGAATGSLSISNLDGRNYSGGLSMGSPGTNLIFGAGIAGSGPGGVLMDLYGQFYDGPGGPAREMGGQFTVQGTGYIGSGTFAASR